MPNFDFNISLDQLELCLLVFFRISAMLMILPFFNSRNIPLIFKAGLAVSMSVLVLPQLQGTRVFPADNMSMLVLRLLGEVAIGITIGLSVQMVFTGIQMTGQLIGFQMTFSIANIMDPAGDMQVPLLSQFYHILAMLIFLATNAHHLLIRALSESFTLVPPLGFHFRQELVDEVMALAGNMFVIAVRLGAPIIIILLLTSVAMGIMARTVPQMHIFIVAMPLQIAVGFLFMGLALPHMTVFLGQLFASTGEGILLLLALCRGGV
jgi:flagellar biosynthetic protein FliR